jgi:hypothetical protein
MVAASCVAVTPTELKIDTAVRADTQVSFVRVPHAPANRELRGRRGLFEQLAVEEAFRVAHVSAADRVPARGINSDDLQGAGVGPAVVQRVVPQQDRSPRTRLVQGGEGLPRTERLEHRADDDAADHPVVGSQRARAIPHGPRNLVQIRRGRQRQLPRRLLTAESHMRVHVDDGGRDSHCVR